MHAIDQLDLAIRAWAASLGFPLEALLRLVLAIIAGGLVGLEREIRGRQAGFRTNILVCVGSALIMIVSTYVPTMDINPGANMHIQSDPARIAYGVMTGIGFIGAGAIIRMGTNIRGLTTAAALWCVAAVGLASGLGMYLLVILTTLLVLGVLWLLEDLQKLFPKLHHRRIVLRQAWSADCITKLTEQFWQWGFQISDVDYQRTPDLKSVDVTLLIEFISTERRQRLHQLLSAEKDFVLLSEREN